MAGEVPNASEVQGSKETGARTCSEGVCSIRLEKAEQTIDQVLMEVGNDRMWIGKEGKCTVANYAGGKKYTYEGQEGERMHVVSRTDGSLQLFNENMRPLGEPTKDMKVLLDTIEAEARFTRVAIANRLKDSAKGYNLKYKTKNEGNNTYYLFNNEKDNPLATIMYDTANNTYTLTTYDAGKKEGKIVGKSYPAKQFDELENQLFEKLDKGK